MWAILDESNCDRKKGNATIKIYLLLYFVKWQIFLFLKLKTVFTYNISKYIVVCV